MTDRELFENVVKEIAKRYPKAQVELRFDFDRYILYAYGEPQFCPDGFNALYNIKRLTDVLENELL